MAFGLLRWFAVILKGCWVFCVVRGWGLGFFKVFSVEPSAVMTGRALLDKGKWCSEHWWCLPFGDQREFGSAQLFAHSSWCLSEALSALLKLLGDAQTLGKRLRAPGWDRPCMGVLGARSL